MKRPPGELELLQCAELVQNLEDEHEPLSYWIEHASSYPRLSTVALDVLATPASSAMERIFSTAGDATTGKRNRLGDKNLEREILMKKNKEYFYT